MHIADKPDEDCVSSSLVYSGSFLKMKRDHVCLKNGIQTIREYLEHPGAAMVIPLFATGQKHGLAQESIAIEPNGRDSQQDGLKKTLHRHILLERQYRYAVQETIIEFPAGKLDPNESSLECAKRELREETGYTAGRWHYLTRIYPSVSYSTESIDLYLAEELTLGSAELEIEECLEIESIPAIELLNDIKQGKIKDVKTIIGAFWLEKVLLGQWGDFRDAR